MEAKELDLGSNLEITAKEVRLAQHSGLEKEPQAHCCTHMHYSLLPCDPARSRSAACTDLNRTVDSGCSFVRPHS